MLDEFDPGLFVAVNVAVAAPDAIDPVEYPPHFVELSASKHVAERKFETRALLEIVIGPCTCKAEPDDDVA